MSRGEGRIAFLLFPAANRAGQRNAVVSSLRAVEQYQVGLGLADGLRCRCRFANGVMRRSGSWLRHSQIWAVAG